MPEIGIVRTAASPLGIEVSASEILGAEDIAPAIATIAKQADALFVVGDPLTFTHRTRINTLALAARLPTTYSTRGYVETGGLMSYGPNFSALFRRAADYVHKILLGAKPSDLPVEQPTSYDLIVNLTTAKALGLQIPESFLLRADEVIGASSSRCSAAQPLGRSRRARTERTRAAIAVLMNLTEDDREGASASPLIPDIRLSRLPARPQPRWRRCARSRAARSPTRAPRRSTH